MREKDNKNYYLDLYFSFLRGEIPNIVQILSFPTLFGVLIKIQLVSPFIVSVIVNQLLTQYFMEKMSKFLYNQIIDNYSIFNIKKLNQDTLHNKWMKYIIITSIIFAIFTGFLTHSINLNS